MAAASGALITVVMKLAIFVEVLLYTLRILKAGGISEDAFGSRAQDDYSFLCPVGPTAGVVGFLIGFFDKRYPGKPKTWVRKERL